MPQAVSMRGAQHKRRYYSVPLDGIPSPASSPTSAYPKRPKAQRHRHISRINASAFVLCCTNTILVVYIQCLVNIYFLSDCGVV